MEDRGKKRMSFGLLKLLACLLVWGILSLFRSLARSQSISIQIQTAICIEEKYWIVYASSSWIASARVERRSLMRHEFQ